MTLADLDQEFVARLENWGRYYGGSGRRQQVSPTHEVCRLLAVAAGQEIIQGFAESNPRPEIDVDDAMTIEWCWAMSRCHVVSRQQKSILKGYFVRGADPRALCRFLQIRWLSWDRLLCESVESFRAAVEMLENYRVNT